MAQTSETSGRKSAWFVWLHRVIFFVGVACCLQFLVFGIIGVARGYSVQSWVPQYVMLLGILILIFCCGKRSVGVIPSSALLILLSVIGLAQGKHKKMADELYGQGKFVEAMEEYRNEIDTWYLRLNFNSGEDVSLFRVAECYAQLEQFAKARETYAEIAAKYEGYYRKRAAAEVVELDEGLAQVHAIEEALAGTTEDRDQVPLLFDLALEYRELTCMRKAVEQYEAIQGLDVDERFKTQAEGFAEKIR